MLCNVLTILTECESLFTILIRFEIFPLLTGGGGFFPIISSLRLCPREPKTFLSSQMSTWTNQCPPPAPQKKKLKQLKKIKQMIKISNIQEWKLPCRWNNRITLLLAPHTWSKDNGNRERADTKLVLPGIRAN